MSRYTIGIDFGSLSGRAVLADVENGCEIASAQLDYPHAIMDQQLPNGQTLPADWALQHPQDYLDGLTATAKGVLAESGIDPAQVVGVGVDFTGCTLLPVTADGTPLCLLPKWQDEPNAYVKLWKHHAAQPQADQLNKLAEAYGYTLENGVEYYSFYPEESPDPAVRAAHGGEA